MRLSIVPEDNAVYVDRECRILDLSDCGIPSNVHALQWLGTNGWIEFSNNEDGSKPENQNIAKLPSWANSAYNVWTEWTAPEPLVTPVIESE